MAPLSSAMGINTSGGYRPQLRMLPAQQRLVTGDATIFDVADSLIVERKLPGVNTAPDIGGHHIALPRLVIHFTFIPANLMVEAAFARYIARLELLSIVLISVPSSG